MAGSVTLNKRCTGANGMRNMTHPVSLMLVPYVDVYQHLWASVVVIVITVSIAIAAAIVACRFHFEGTKEAVPNGPR